MRTSFRLKLTVMNWVTTFQARSQAGWWTIRPTIGRVTVWVLVAPSRSTAPVTIIVSNLPLRVLVGRSARRWAQVPMPVSFSCLKRALRLSTESFRWCKLPPTVTTSGSRFNRKLKKKEKGRQSIWGHRSQKVKKKEVAGCKVKFHCQK